MSAPDVPEEARTELPFELEELLTQLGRGLQRYTLYPPDHPALQPVAEDLAERIRNTLSTLGSLDLAVTPRQLMVMGETTDPDHPVFAPFAERLHERGVSRLTVRPAVDVDELEALLDRLSVAAETREDVESLVREARGWDTISIDPRDYGSLALAEEEAPEEPSEEEEDEGEEESGGRGAGGTDRLTERRSRELWLGLARVALAGPPGGSSGPGGGDEGARSVEEARAARGAAGRLGLAREEDEGEGGDRPAFGVGAAPGGSGEGEGAGGGGASDGEGQEGEDGAAGGSGAAGAAVERPGGPEGAEAEAAEEDAGAEAELEELEDASPGEIAQAIESFSSQAAYNEAISNQLLQIADELVGKDEAADPELRGRFQEVLESLSGASLAQVVIDGGPDKGRQLLQRTTEALPVDAVLQMVERAAEETDLRASEWMLRLIRSLADHAQFGGTSLAGEAEGEFRDQVKQLFDGWNPGEWSPEPYQEALHGMTRRQGLTPGGTDVPSVTPVRVLQMGLEVDASGPSVHRAVQKLNESGEIDQLVTLLEDAPADRELAEELWDYVQTEDVVRRVLESDPPNFDALERLVDRMGMAAAEPMLDVLSESESRTTRRRLFSQLASLGPPLVPRLEERLADDRWFVKRNMLSLMVEVGATPEGFDAERYTRHPHAAVRREAYRLLLREPEGQQEAIRAVLEEDDPRLISLGIAAAESVSPGPKALARIRGHVADPDLPDDLRRSGVRCLESAGDDASRDVLVDLCLVRRFLTFWKRSLAEKSPVVLGAVQALASGWEEDPEARRVVEKAAASEDPDFRAAAGVLEDQA